MTCQDSNCIFNKNEKCTKKGKCLKLYDNSLDIELKTMEYWNIKLNTIRSKYSKESTSPIDKQTILKTKQMAINHIETLEYLKLIKLLNKHYIRLINYKIQYNINVVKACNKLLNIESW